MSDEHQRTEQDAERELEESTDAGYRDTEEQRAYERAGKREAPPGHPAGGGSEEPAGG